MERVVFINLYWKDALSEKPGKFRNPGGLSTIKMLKQDVEARVEVIYSFPRSGRDA